MGIEAGLNQFVYFLLVIVLFFAAAVLVHRQKEQITCMLLPYLVYDIVQINNNILEIHHSGNSTTSLLLGRYTLIAFDVLIILLVLFCILGWILKKAGSSRGS